jgi:hypothetical protein
VQGLMHWCWMHALLSGHSESLSHSPTLTGRLEKLNYLGFNTKKQKKKGEHLEREGQHNLLGVQFENGSPVVPGGHVQVAL